MLALANHIDPSLGHGSSTLEENNFSVIKKAELSLDQKGGEKSRASLKMAAASN